MSTILDALRKVEQDHRAQNTDVRARLLTLPPRPHPRTPQKKLLPWVISLGLALVGFLIGAGTMYGPSLMITFGSDSASALLEPVAKPAPNKSAAAPAVEDTPPAEPSAQPFVPTPSQRQSTPALVAVQRSPFTSTPSSELAEFARPTRPTASPSLPQSEYISEYIIEPLPQDLWADEALPPEDEAHFLSPAPQPLPVPAPVLRPPAPRLDASLSFLQWSPEAAERIAFIKFADGPLSMVYEGDSVGGFTIVEIHKDKVDLRSNDADGASLTLRVR